MFRSRTHPGCPFRFARSPVDSSQAAADEEKECASIFRIPSPAEESEDGFHPVRGRLEVPNMRLLEPLRVRDVRSQLRQHRPLPCAMSRRSRRIPAASRRRTGRQTRPTWCAMVGRLDLRRVLLLESVSGHGLPQVQEDRRRGHEWAELR